jgi:NADPH2:quinone reductase
MPRTNSAGVDLVVDSVGGKTLQGSVSALAHRGRCVSVGAAGRTGGNQLDTSILAIKNAGVFGYYLGGELSVGRRAYDMITAQLAAVSAGTLKVVVDRTFPLSQATEAHAYIESRQAFGRVVLKP